MLGRASAILTQLTRIPVTLAYAAILAVVTTVLLAIDPGTHDKILGHVSTNLHNLRHGHFGTLLSSAFVTDAGPVYAWLPGLVCLLALAELLWRSKRLVLAFAVGHVGATLLVAAGLTVAVRAGWAPASVSRDVDVGMSYGAAAVLGALTAAIAVRWRPAWVGFWLAVGVAVVAQGPDFTGIGHVVALILGMVLSAWLGRPQGWTAVRYLLLSVAAFFGLALLAGDPALFPFAAGAGVLGATVAGALTPHRGGIHDRTDPVAESATRSDLRDPGGSPSSSADMSHS
ncbi:rhomboid-like protein [Mycolicibacterium neworleansense]|uniref:Putative transmembrane protein n=1 Tax=Mycolicibacterium neworleansense TaxID=146018 RepID=A0A0H5RZ51_9MYCO|nr:rhomboid-like protein [Mycolicibacterium neworleansense]MCV7363136.1 hypothetical protein [Mycolicibacterium neworleansense]CRZ13979.1 putative transmembrane protein [Mycolicibacterium neworleansense]